MQKTYGIAAVLLLAGIGWIYLNANDTNAVQSMSPAQSADNQYLPATAIRHNNPKQSHDAVPLSAAEAATTRAMTETEQANDDTSSQTAIPLDAFLTYATEHGAFNNRQVTQLMQSSTAKFEAQLDQLTAQDNGEVQFQQDLVDRLTSLQANGIRTQALQCGQGICLAVFERSNAPLEQAQLQRLDHALRADSKVKMLQYQDVVVAGQTQTRLLLSFHPKINAVEL